MADITEVSEDSSASELETALRARLSEAQICDAFALGKRVAKFLHTSPAVSSNDLLGQQGELSRLLSDLEASKEKCDRRAQWIPATQNYPPQLPVSGKAQEIAALIRCHQVVVVAGDTGSGKTTQLPKICLEAGLGRRGIIGHTQPRRLAALAVAERIGDEMGAHSAEGIGSQVRFDDRTGPNTYLKLMTDGILLAEIQADRFLSKYEAIIIDEAHERSLNIDFLLGFLRDLIDRRPELKIVITSATIDVEKFASHFADAPIVSVEGRTFPVEVRYRPILLADESGRNDDPQADAVIEAVRDILLADRQSAGESGDILVFLPSEREIRDTALALRKSKIGDLEILPLYGRLQHAEQKRIFSKHSTRRVVLATNVAETSITVPGINYVIDTGTARISRYSLQSKVQRLPIEKVSQASANQRKGRCGRVANGICIRLYSEEDFDSRPEYTDPEIQRTNLAAVILRMLSLRLGNIDAFPFLEMPEQKAINEGYKLLLELNAITADRALTAIGRQMSALPIDPRYSRMLIEANKLDCLRDVLIIVSGLTIQDPRESYSDNRQLAAERHAEYRHPESDFMSLVLLWESYERLRQDSSQAVLRKYCKKQFLSFMRMREWREVHRQLLLSAQKLRFRLADTESDYAGVHKSLLVGSLNQLARKTEDRSYVGTRNKKFSLFGSSVLARSNAKWIMTGEQIETSQVFATQAAKIQPEWVEDVAMHLVKRESFDPHWSRKRQEVMAYEKVHLFGLTLIERALVRFAPIDSTAARGLFIRHGLVAHEAAADLRFMRDNSELISRLEKLEEKLRRPDVLVSEQQLVEFFERKLPLDVCSTKTLKDWLRKLDDRHGDCLRMSEEDLLDQVGSDVSFDAFPDAAAIQSNTLNIDYIFDPGKAHDGATIDIPLALLLQLTPADIDWSVPGIIKEKCTALLKGLPKARRKLFIPISGFVEELSPFLKSNAQDLLDTLCAAIFARRRLQVGREEFDAVELMSHLTIKIRVIDGSGKELAVGHSLTHLQEALAPTVAPLKTPAGTSGVATPTPAAVHPIEQEGLLEMPSQPLPASLEVGEGNFKLLRYPCLIDELTSVSIRLSPDPLQAEVLHSAGVLRLLFLNSVQQRNALKKQFSRFTKEQSLRLPGGLDDVVEQCLTACFLASTGPLSAVRDKQAYSQLLLTAKQSVMGVGDRLVALLNKILVSRVTVRQRLLELDSLPSYVKQDIDAQLQRLFCADFVVRGGFDRLGSYPRYLDALLQRLAKAPFMGPKDESETVRIARYVQKIQASEMRADSDLHWLIEEYRVSVFAQGLKTKVPVSPQRIDKAFSKAGL